jgi:hypothetical protein
LKIPVTRGSTPGGVGIDVDLGHAQLRGARNWSASTPLAP